MAYEFYGEFLEACDCYVVCPCWMGNAPDEEHCVGMFVWFIHDGSIRPLTGDPGISVDITGAAVAAVTTHEGDRADRRRTILYIDTRAVSDRSAHAILDEAFRGRLGGPLQDLARPVFGTVELTHPCAIEGERGIDAAEPAVVSLRALDAAEPFVTSSSSTTDLVGRTQPSVLTGTALSGQVSDTITLRRGRVLDMNVPLLDIEVNVDRRSAVSGRFHYVYRDAVDSAAAREAEPLVVGD